MNIYILIYEENSDYKCGSDCLPCLSLAQAQAQMKQAYSESVANNPMSVQDDDHHCEIGETSASIVNGIDSYTWRIEEKELDIRAIIHLHGGLVQEIFATADFSVTVYDTDSDDPDLDEEIEGMKKHMQELCVDPAWVEIVP